MPGCGSESGEDWVSGKVLPGGHESKVPTKCITCPSCKFSHLFANPLHIKSFTKKIPKNLPYFPDLFYSPNPICLENFSIHTLGPIISF